MAMRTVNSLVAEAAHAWTSRTMDLSEPVGFFDFFNQDARTTYSNKIAYCQPRGVGDTEHLLPIPGFQESNSGVRYYVVFFGVSNGGSRGSHGSTD